MLAVTDEATVAFAALRLEVDDLLALDDAVDGESHLRAFDIGGSDLERGAIRHGENRREFSILARFDRDLFNLDLVTDADERLLAAGFEYCVCFHCSVFLPSAFLVETLHEMLDLCSILKIGRSRQ